MKRAIVAWVKGDIDTLFRKWTMPQGIICRTHPLPQAVTALKELIGAGITIEGIVQAAKSETIRFEAK